MKTHSGPVPANIPPDVILVDAEWPERALIRAQLIEQGYEVIALETGPIPASYRLPQMTPRVMLVSLRGLADPRDTLEDVRTVIAPDRVLVLTASGTLSNVELRKLGFQLIERPASVGDIVAAITALIAATAPRG